MNIEDCFNLHDLKKELEIVYDPSHPGALSIPKFLTDDILNKLMNDMINHSSFFYHVHKKNRTGVEEQYDVVHLEELNALDAFPVTRQLITTYAKLHENTGINRNFNSISIQRYMPDYKGITPHMDFAKDRDIVSLFCIHGAADFGVCDDKHKANPRLLDSSPGSLILLRAPRNEKDKRDKSWRPYHFVENIQSERYSIGIRHVTS
jgi:hypothetical protein